MSKKKLVVALLACLGLGGGVWGGMAFLKKDWPDRKQELANAVSAEFQKSGAPSKQVADKAAACVADALVAAAAQAECPAEGEDVLKAMGECINSSQEVQIVYMMAIPTCVQDSLQ